jgi:serine/threonine protein kinase
MNKAQIKVELNELLTIDNVVYHVAEHPALPGVPYVQRGARGFVIQLKAPNKERFALKYFKIKYRVPELAEVGKTLRQYAALPGLRAANRIVFTLQSHPQLVRKYPPLEYGTLMPWLPGVTWFDVIVRRMPLTPRESLQLAMSAATVLATLEANGIAHCDIAGANVMVERTAGKVELVDIEEMHGGNLPRPVELPGGQEGYQHRANAQSGQNGQVGEMGQWTAEGDRFGGAVLIAEMLGWQNAKIRENSADEHYFSALEVQQPDSPRYKLLFDVLRTEYTPELADHFETAWHSTKLADCPPLSAWQQALAKLDPSAASTIAIPANAPAIAGPLAPAPIISGRRPLLPNVPAPSQPTVPSTPAIPLSAPSPTSVSQSSAVLPAPAPAVKLCPNCGTANALNAEFCTNCRFYLRRDQPTAKRRPTPTTVANHPAPVASASHYSPNSSVTPAPPGAPPIIAARRMVAPGQSGQSVPTPEPEGTVDLRVVALALLIGAVLTIIVVALAAH